MKLLETTLESTKDKVGLIYNAEVECQAGVCTIYKKRTFEIPETPCCFHFKIDHDISFKNFGENGLAYNDAEIYLRPEEYPAFIFALKEHEIPFPTNYRQWQKVNPHIISVCIESVEPPEHFAERLSSALKVLEQ